MNIHMTGHGASSCAIAGVQVTPATCGRQRLYARRVAVVRMFASAREAAGTGSDVIDGATVGEVLDRAVTRYGSGFGQVLATCRIWVNGEAAGREAQVCAGDEVAVLPPVSGGFG
jgi:molybdopterin synthase sulfur carrier subunit